MIRYFLGAVRAHYLSGRTLYALSVLGVALGVASVLSIQIINRNALGAFEGSMRAVSGEADFSILGRTGSFPETLYPEVLKAPEVVAAWPLYRLDVTLAGSDDVFLEIVGLDLFAPVRIPWDSAPGDSAAPLAVAGWVAISPRLAEEQGLRQGSAFSVTSGSRVVPLVVGALVDFQKITPLASSRMLVMDIAQAQGLFGGRGILQQIDVVLEDGADAGAVMRRMDAELGPAVMARTPEQRRDEAAGLMGAFRLNLTSLSLISLFVGGFLVYASTQASLVRRRNEFGLLRTLGTTRMLLFRLIMGEVLLLGTLGVALGIPLGYAAAAYNVELVSATLSNLYMLEEIERLELPPLLYVMAATIGLGGAVAGALPPALDMARQDPRALLAAYTLHEEAGRGAGRLLLAGFALLGLATLAGTTVLAGTKPAGFVIGVALLVAVPLAAPWVVGQATRRLAPRGFGLLYGVKALALRLKTTAFAVAALAVAVSMLFGITLMIGSFRRTVEIWLSTTLQADVYVTTESWRRGRESAVLDAELVESLTRLPGVRAVDRLRQFSVYTGQRRIVLSGVDFDLDLDGERFELFQGDPQDALRQIRDEGAVLISEPLAIKENLAVGDDLRVEGPAGPLVFPIAGVFYDYSSERGGAGMDLRTMEAAFGPGAISNVALYLDEGVGVEELVDRLKARFAGLPLVIRSNRGIREEVFRIFDQTFAVTRLLQSMSLLIAVCGITLTLIVLARERVSELALYRALGAHRQQIFRVFLGKGLGMAVFGLLIGAVGGVALALILVFMINRAWFGWTIALHWPWWSLGQGALSILLAAALASVYPALRASRTPATELSRENLG